MCIVLVVHASCMHGTVRYGFSELVSPYYYGGNVARPSRRHDRLRSKAETPNWEVYHTKGATASRIAQLGDSSPNATAFNPFSLSTSELNRARSGQESQEGIPYRNRESVRKRGRFITHGIHFHTITKVRSVTAESP